MMSSPRTSLFIAALLGAGGVAAGAFGSHMLSDVLTPKDMRIYATGIAYLQWHAVYLFVLSWVSREHDNRGLLWARRCGLGGIVLFTGSLVTLSLTGLSFLGAVAPIGGSLLIGSWLLTAWGVRSLER